MASYVTNNSRSRSDSSDSCKSITLLEMKEKDCHPICGEWEEPTYFYCPKNELDVDLFNELTQREIFEEHEHCEANEEWGKGDNWAYFQLVAWFPERVPNPNPKCKLCNCMIPMSFSE